MSGRTRSQRTRRTENATQEEDHTIDPKKQSAISDLVKYFLMHLNCTPPLQRSAMVLIIRKHTTDNADAIIAKAAELLEKTFGYELCLGKNTKSDKFYFIRNALKSVDIAEDGLQEETPLSRRRDVAFVILSCLFMASSLTHEELARFLKQLHMDPERPHPIYGSIEAHIKDLTKELMLEVKENKYCWGPKAEMTVSKHECLKFVARVYKNRPENWTKQFAEAEEQKLTLLVAHQ